MARVTGRIIDKNRYAKKYPLIRVPKVLTYVGNDQFTVEVLSATFTNEESKDVYFEIPYENTNYRVLLSPRQLSSGESAQVALSVDNANSDTQKIKIEASAPFTGIVDIVVLYVA